MEGMGASVGRKGGTAGGNPTVGLGPIVERKAFANTVAASLNVTEDDVTADDVTADDVSDDAAACRQPGGATGAMPAQAMPMAMEGEHCDVNVM